MKNKKNLLFRFRTDENALQIYIPNQCILAKILLNIELKRLWRKTYLVVVGTCIKKFMIKKLIACPPAEGVGVHVGAHSGYINFSKLYNIIATVGFSFFDRNSDPKKWKADRFSCKFFRKLKKSGRPFISLDRNSDPNLKGRLGQ